MRFLQLLWWGGKFVFFTMASWLIVYGTALAERAAPKVEQKKEGEYVTSYALVMLGILLGLLLVCRSSQRRDRARPEQYAESKVTATE